MLFILVFIIMAYHVVESIGIGRTHTANPFKFIVDISRLSPISTGGSCYNSFPFPRHSVM